MKKKQLERMGYVKPECEMIQAEAEQFICTSVRLNSGASSTESGWSTETEHEGGSIYFGDESSAAPAKGAWLYEEN